MAKAGLQAAADAARSRADWAEASRLYQQLLEINPTQIEIQVQLAHSLKEAARLREAAVEYRRVAASRPRDPDPWLHLGHLLKQMGDASGANQAFREALRRDPSATGPRDELINAGARDQIPGDAHGPAAAAVESARLARLLGQGIEGLAEGAERSAFPLSDHDSFRRQYPIQPPPMSGDLAVTVVITTVDATAAMLRATLVSLMDQRHQDWTAFMSPAQPLADHSVGSFSQVDDRIRFERPERDVTAGPVVLVPAGTVLDREALGWLAYGLVRTRAAAVYCDHDHYAEDWRLGLVRHSPRLQTMFDPDAMATSPAPPSIAIFRDGTAKIPDAVLAGLMEASLTGPVAHLPRLLASVPPAPAAASSLPTILPIPAESASRILVIIPTRDEAAMLERSITTLRETARYPERVSVLIVDNRSVEPATSATIERLTRIDAVDSFSLDEPFNWPRCNNLAARRGEGEILVFANNDIEMLSAGWDESVRRLLARPDVGVLGARLLYPDGGVQHAGILLGGWQGRPSHDGLWASAEDEGPLNRWTSTRAAAAVTGAFMACRRDTFQAVGGFDERLAIAYNDIDFCLKVRKQGLKVMFARDIELVHYESRTRGHNDSAAKVAWDDAELADMHARWAHRFSTIPATIRSGSMR